MDSETFKILIIEDNETDALMIRHLLSMIETVNYEPVHARNLVEGVSRLKKKDMDLVMISLHLPGCRGFDAFQKILEFDDTLPILALSSRTDENMAFQSLQHGAQDYLIKEYLTASDLSRALRYAIDRVSSTAAIKDSEKKFYNLVAKNNDAILVVNSEGIILYANPAAEAVFRTANKELFGKRIGCPIALDSSFEVGINRKDNEPGIAELRTIQVSWEKSDCYLLLFKDITDRKHAEKKLHESEALYKALFEKSPIALLLQDFSGAIDYLEILKKESISEEPKHYLALNKDKAECLVGAVKTVQANRAALDLYKIDSTEKLCLDFYAVVNRDDIRHLVDQVIDFNDGKDWYESEIQTHDFKGNEINVIVRKAVLDRENKGLSTVLVSIVDVTDIHRYHKEKVEMEKRLLQAQKMEAIGTLAGGIAHDFNNILSGILGFTELAIDEAEKGTILENDLQEIYTGGKRAKELVKQILWFARQSDEKIRPVKPDLIAKEVLKFIRSSIPATIKIESDILTDSLIAGSSIQVHQIFMNLCTNAAHAMEDNGGVLKVTLSNVEMDTPETVKRPGLKKGHFVEIKVSDTGTGIAPEIMDLIFEPYFSTKKPGEGTGIGLALVKGIVENYGGSISVASEPGKGSIFTIHLPVLSELGVQQPYGDRDSPTGTERILYVDDELTIVKIADRILKGLGYSVTTRTSSIEALDLFKSNPADFDLIVSDMTMPKMTGDQLARELIAIRPDIPIIICTGYSEKINKEKTKIIGVKEFLMKPVVQSEMAQTVRKVLDQVRNKKCSLNILNSD
ncbi:MAG: response regulator [Desulfobacula sp.]|jgi:PAS domain S-box-containing protein